MWSCAALTQLLYHAWTSSDRNQNQRRSENQKILQVGVVKSHKTRQKARKGEPPNGTYYLSLP